MRFLSIGALAALLVFAGCSGGGSSGGGGGGGSLQALDQDTLVVQMDQNGDGELDLVTLDLSESPFVILECLYGMPGGDFDDVTRDVKGQPIDSSVSGALATYVGNTVVVEDRTELDVTNHEGDPMKVVVFGMGGENGARPGLAQVALEVKPACAAPGDAVLLVGSEFAEAPTVTIGGAEAEVLRSSAERIVCRVPAGLAEDDATIDVDGATTSLHVLAEGAPVLVYVSSETATPGMLLFFVGARLRGATATFGDSGVTANLDGGSHVAFLKVPADLEPGTYTLVIANSKGDTGPCSPSLKIAEPGTPTITSIAPEEQLPGRPVLCKGTDLGPVGFCFLTWTDGNGDSVYGWGFANGYDRVHTWVPGDATAGGTYDVTIGFDDGGSAGPHSYTVGTPPAPEITELEHTKGPAGSLVGIRGHNLLGSGWAWPIVHFTQNGVPHEALIYYAFGGFGGYGGAAAGGSGPNALQGSFKEGSDLDEIVVEVPRDLEDGDCDVAVTVNGQKSNAVVFTVSALPLTVTSMTPTSQSQFGPRDIVVIEGTGFGVPDFDFFIQNGSGVAATGFGGNDPSDPFAGAFKVSVSWQGATGDPLFGYVLWHTDREILVVPPGGWEDPLPLGTYTVSVTVERDNGDKETVKAGTYTVEKKNGGGSFPFPGGNSGSTNPGDDNSGFTNK